MGSLGWKSEGRYIINVNDKGDELELLYLSAKFWQGEAPAGRVAELDALMQGVPSVKNGCDRAAHCCEEAALLGLGCDLDLELGDRRWLRQCLDTIEGSRFLLTEAQKEIPASCAAAD